MRSFVGRSLLIALAVLLWVAPAAQADPAKAVPELPAAVFVGSEECASCHDDMEGTIAGTPHGTSFFNESATHGCETCHGPGGNHVDDPEGNPLRLTDLTAEEQSATCQGCHSGREQFFWEGGDHEARGLSCLSCHSVHAPESQKGQLRAATAMEQCFSCHKDVRAESWKLSHHPIREGQLGCSDCHNPHGSTTDGMLREASLNDQCYTCHAEKRGPYLWEHPPVREDCNSCHESHGSNHTKLKVAEVPYLCQRCHVNTRHPGTLYDGSRLVGGTGESNRVTNRSCVNCHAAIHGSNHPSSPYLSH
jgi:DmsE family decaheme c-type cytochrome